MVTLGSTRAPKYYMCPGRGKTCRKVNEISEHVWRAGGDRACLESAACLLVAACAQKSSTTDVCTTLNHALAAIMCTVLQHRWDELILRQCCKWACHRTSGKATLRLGRAGVSAVGSTGAQVRMHVSTIRVQGLRCELTARMGDGRGASRISYIRCTCIFTSLCVRGAGYLLRTSCVNGN